MNGFIEVHDETGRKRFVNTRYIEEVWENGDNSIIYSGIMRNDYEQEFINTSESYEEVKLLIKQAK